jgi:hypothetical protein
VKTSSTDIESGGNVSGGVWLPKGTALKGIMLIYSSGLNKKNQEGFTSKCPQTLCHDLLDVAHSSKMMTFELNPQFITCYDTFENIFVIFDAFKKVQEQIRSVFLLFVGEDFWDHLDTNFQHAQFFGQNVVDGLTIQIQLTTDHSDCQMSIRPYESPHFGHFLSVFELQSFQHEVRLPHAHGHPKMLYAT